MIAAPLNFLSCHKLYELDEHYGEQVVGNMETVRRVLWLDIADITLTCEISYIYYRSIVHL